MLLEMFMQSLHMQTEKHNTLHSSYDGYSCICTYYIRCPLMYACNVNI